MQRDVTAGKVADLFEQVGKDHHQAFIAADGEDPDWAVWYAGHLAAPLTNLLGTSLHQADLVCFLMQAADEHAARAPERPWPEFYADLLVERFAAEAEEKLALYHFDSCPYCLRVRQVINELGVDVELRDIHRDRTHHQDLVAARGRATVPVLRCTSAEKDRWMPESRDIMRYLRERFG